MVHKAPTYVADVCAHEMGQLGLRVAVREKKNDLGRGAALAFGAHYGTKR